MLAPAAGAAADPDALAAALAETQLAIDTTDRDQNEAVFQWQKAFFLQQLGRTDEATAALAAATALDSHFAPVTVADLVPQPGGRVVPVGEGGAFSLPGYALAYTGRELLPLTGLALLLLVGGTLLITLSKPVRRRA